MNTQNGKYSPAFKFKVVLESLRAGGRGVEAEVARAYGIHLVTPHLEAAVLGAGGGTRKGRLMAMVDVGSAWALGGRASRELAALGSTKNPPRSRHASPVTHHSLFVTERQMIYYNTERRHSGLDYRAPVMYLEEAGIHPRVLVEIGPPSGSVLRAQVPRAVDHFVAQDAETWTSDALFNLGGNCTVSILDVAKRVAGVYVARYKQKDPITVEVGPDDGQTRWTAPFRYSVDRLLGTGFRLEGNMEIEIARTMEVCELFLDGEQGEKYADEECKKPNYLTCRSIASATRRDSNSCINSSEIQPSRGL